MTLTKACFVFFLLFFGAVFSQIVEGHILDSETELPLVGATVYFDGTTIVSITNEEGYFKINGSNSSNAMIVSFIGYNPHRFENPAQYLNKKLKLFLDKSLTDLEEVVIGKSPFSRKQMLEVFRRQFLGTSKAAASCKILNEDDIVLYFDVSDNTLSASARNPLKIINKHLEYEVHFDLVDFSQKFSVKSLDQFYMRQSFFTGSTFYRDLSKKGNADKKRLNKFLGSTPHLMITIANEDWENQKFVLFVGGFKTDPKKYFSVKDTIGLKKITVIEQPMAMIRKQNTLTGKIVVTENVSEKDLEMQRVYFNVLYKDMQSIMDFRENEIYVDENGNHSPLYNVQFGGIIGAMKAGDMLPRDYYQTVKSKPNN